MCSHKKNGHKRIDPCMRGIINFLNFHNIKTLACCCGHGVYPPTIVVAQGPLGKTIEKKITLNGAPWEIYSGQWIPRIKKFYKRDANGIFYIPETILTENIEGRFYRRLWIKGNKKQKVIGEIPVENNAVRWKW